MAGKFITGTALEKLDVDWGSVAFLSNPSSTGASQLTVMDVILTPGNGHDFHKHPDQEEVIYVIEGHVEQWLESERKELKAGEAVYIPAGLVHASFNIGATPAKLMVSLSPCVGESGYELVDVADQAPWNNLR